VAEFSTTVRTRSLNQAVDAAIDQHPEEQSHDHRRGDGGHREQTHEAQVQARAGVAGPRVDQVVAGARPPRWPAMQTIRARLKPRTTRMTVVAVLIGPVSGGDEARRHGRDGQDHRQRVGAAGQRSVIAAALATRPG
jgi:hypothetical protein